MSMSDIPDAPDESCRHRETVRLPPSTATEIQRLVEEGDYPNRSAAIRAGVRLLIEHESRESERSTNSDDSPDCDSDASTSSPDCDSDASTSSPDCDSDASTGATDCDADTTTGSAESNASSPASADEKDRVDVR